ncbi:MAG: dephospho-CoA kinase [Candidatus Aminicenantes bacterium]|nr:MAG: dephospho-CoA kinase [Candidatus Aminicenantes bacterium]
MNPRPCTVGLTGGMASGKSSVARILETLGAEIFDCDAYVHELYRPGGAGAMDVDYLFGETVLSPDGGVDRTRLAGLVLADPAARSRLEGAIHPLVRSGVEAWLGTLGPQAVAVVEAALLVETGSWRVYDLLAVVWCEADQQLERAVARGVPADRARGLLAAQMPMTDKRELAQVVIDNSGTRKELESEVQRAWGEILESCRHR